MVWVLSFPALPVGALELSLPDGGSVSTRGKLWGGGSLATVGPGGLMPGVGAAFCVLHPILRTTTVSFTRAVPEITHTPPRLKNI